MTNIISKNYITKKLISNLNSNSLRKNNIINKNLIICLSIFLVLSIGLYYFIKNSTIEFKISDVTEGFLIKQKNNQYMKYNETYLDPSDYNKDTLYKNYSGAGNNKSMWNNVTLDQCVDRCNKIDSCVGFTRENINDKEKGICLPKNKVTKCYSNRKGNFEQRQNAINYNTYIKSKVKNQRTICLGDDELTMNRMIFIKSYAYPNSYIGLKNNKIRLIDRNNNEMAMFLSCKFKIEIGKDGSETVSFKHVETGKYLYRNKKDMLECKLLNKSTNDKQRSSFILHDGLSNQVRLKCFPLSGEKHDRFVSSDDKGKYLKILTSSQIKQYSYNRELVTFDIVNYVDNNSILKFIDTPKEEQKTEDFYNDESLDDVTDNHKNQEQFESTGEQDNGEEIASDLELYKKMSTGQKKTEFENFYIEDDMHDLSIIEDLEDDKRKADKEALSDLKQGYESYNKLNNITVKNTIRNLKNKNTEKMNDTYQGLDHLRMKDMAKDYYYFKDVADMKDVDTLK